MFQHIEYVAQGRTWSGSLVAPTGPARGGVLVCHGGSGLTDHDRERAGRFAALGFVAFAPDLFGEPFTDRAHGHRVIGALVAEPAVLRERLAAALARLAAEVDPARLAVVGHCFGGLAALELARSGQAVRVAISYHGGLATHAPARPGEVRARILACSGADDPHCPRDVRAAFEDEMTAAGVDWQHHVHGGAQHGFTIRGIAAAGCAYDERADRRSWQATVALLDEAFTG